jgi:hypothetical protein
MIGFDIAGVAIIVLAMLGVSKRIDIAVRLYLIYLLATFILDTGFFVYELLWNDHCHNVSGLATTALMGQAFMCGFLRIMSYLFVAAAICAEVYCLYIVWSFCEDVHEGVNGPELKELLPAKEEAFLKKHTHMHGEREGPYANIIGLAYYSDFPGSYPEPCGAFKHRFWSMAPAGGHHDHGGPHGPTYFGY